MQFAVNVKNGKSKTRRKVSSIKEGIEIYDVQMFDESGEYIGGVAHFVKLEDAKKEVAEAKKDDKTIDVRIIPDVITGTFFENGITVYKTKNGCILSEHGLKLTSYEVENKIGQ